MRLLSFMAKILDIDGTVGVCKIPNKRYFLRLAKDGWSVDLGDGLLTAGFRLWEFFRARAFLRER